MHLFAFGRLEVCTGLRVVNEWPRRHLADISFFRHFTIMFKHLATRYSWQPFLLHMVQVGWYFCSDFQICSFYLTVTNRLSSNGWFNVIVTTKLETAISRHSSPCLSSSVPSLEMENIAREQEDREHCLLKNLLIALRIKNISCTPPVYRSYPEYYELTTDWCPEGFNEDLYHILNTVFKTQCPRPCSTIDYGLSVEPFHGAGKIAENICGKPSTTIFFLGNENAQITKASFLRHQSPQYPKAFLRNL